MEAGKIYASLFINKDGSNTNNSLEFEADAKLLEELSKKGFSPNELDNYNNFHNALQAHGIKTNEEGDRQLKGLYSEMFGEGGSNTRELDQNRDGRITFDEINQVINQKGFTIGIHEMMEGEETTKTINKEEVGRSSKEVEQEMKEKGIDPEVVRKDTIEILKKSGHLKDADSNTET